jgi:hypothetical protein
MRLKSELFVTNDVFAADDDRVHKDRQFQLYMKKEIFLTIHIHLQSCKSNRVKPRVIDLYWNMC